MAQYTIVDISVNKFSINGRQLFKTFQPVYLNEDRISLVNVYDSNSDLFRNVLVSEIELDAFVYPNATALISALVPVTFVSPTAGNISQAQIDANTAAISVLETGKADVIHNHNDLYYLKNEIDSIISNLPTGTYVTSGNVVGSDLVFYDSAVVEVFRVDCTSFQTQGNGLIYNPLTGYLNLVNSFGTTLSSISLQISSIAYDDFVYADNIDATFSNILYSNDFVLARKTDLSLYFLKKKTNLTVLDNCRIIFEFAEFTFDTTTVTESNAIYDVYEVTGLNFIFIESNLYRFDFRNILTSVSVPDVSDSVSGIVNLVELQELGGVDKLINGVRVGKGGGSNGISLSVNSLSNVTSASRFVAIGEALRSLVSGSNNIGIGWFSLNDLTTTGGNVALGSNSLQLCQSNSNTAVGAGAVSGLVTGDDNTGVGANVLRALGSRNIGMGVRAGGTSNTGDDNSFLGSNSCRHTTSGSENSALGSDSGRFLADGIAFASDFSNCTILGAFSRISANGVTNEVVIGHGAIGKGSNTAKIGDTNITDVYVDNNINAGAFIKDGGASNEFLMADGSVTTGGGGGGLPYMLYSVSLSQSGTNAPIATNFQNDLSGTMTWARTGVGVYTLTNNNASFVLDSTSIHISGGGLTAESVLRGSYTSSSVLTFTNWHFLQEAAEDGILGTDCFIEIKVYPI